MCWGKDGGGQPERPPVRERQGHSELVWPPKTSWKPRRLPPCSVPQGTREGSGGQNSHLVSPYWTDDPSEGCINAAMDASEHSSHRLLEEVPLLQGQCVGLGDDGDDVDHLTEAPHELHVQRPETGGSRRGSKCMNVTCVVGRGCNYQDRPPDGSHGFQCASTNCCS